jgi:phosphatidylinositol glycan class B
VHPKSTPDFLKQVWLPVVLLLAALPRLGLAWFEHGVNHPDEIFQMLEPAHRWVYGYGIQSWEFKEGARSWLLPGLLALLWKGLAGLGLSDPLTLVPLLRMPFVALSVYGVFLSSRLARRWTSDASTSDVSGGLAALLSAFAPLALVLDFRTTTEAASAPVVLLALLAMADKRTARAGAYLALLVFLRPTNGVIGLGAVLSLLLERRFRDSFRLGLGALPVMVAGGLLDWATWGRPFHHLVQYLKFNWLDSGADIFGVQPAYTYVLLLLSCAPLLVLFILPVVVTLLRKVPQSRTSLVVAGVYLVVISMLGHKEARFLLPILPLLATLTAAGVATLVAPWLDRHATAAQTRALTLVAAAVLVVFGMLGARGLTFEDVQDARGEPHDRLLFGKRNSINRLLVKAGEQSDLCGLLILGLMPNELFSGGTTYLHRDVLLTSPSTRPMWALMSQAANYAVSPKAAQPAGWHAVAEHEDIVLLNRPGQCLALPEPYRPTYARPSAKTQSLAR